MEGEPQMDRVRGVVMVIAGCFALYEGWRIHTGSRVFLAAGLGVLALALGAWHLTRKSQTRLR
jgi:drug/metabolite transporter superfamily protein YnfA